MAAFCLGKPFLEFKRVTKHLTQHTDHEGTRERCQNLTEAWTEKEGQGGERVCQGLTTFFADDFFVGDHVRSVFFELDQEVHRDLRMEA